jgi:hypothetical protein
LAQSGLAFIAVVDDRVTSTFWASVAFALAMVGVALSTGFAFGFLFAM